MEAPPPKPIPISEVRSHLNEIRRPPGRQWMLVEGNRPPHPHHVPWTTLPSGQPSPEAKMTKHNGQGHSYPPKFHPYNLYQRQLLQFTIHDLDNCLFGKQELRVVQIGDRKATPPSTAPKGLNVGPSSSEDKNKPAKWCDMCQEIRFGECPQHGPLPSLRPTLTLPGPKSYAISTFPDEVGLCISTLPLAGYGVFARHFIPLGTWIGPYEGKKIPVEDGLKQISVGDAPFLWEIYENLRLSHFLDASDENASSWMRFIQCARHRDEQNLFVFQYYGSIYYRAFKDIPVGSELLVWYDDKYPQYFGMPYDIRDMSSFSMESIQAPTEVPKKPGEFDPARPHHAEPGRAPHPFLHGSKMISGTNGSGTARGERNEPPRVPPPGHVIHPRSHGHPSSSFQAPPAEPPTLSVAPTINDTRTIHSVVHVSQSHLHAPHTTHPAIPQGHSPRPSSINAAFRRETPDQISSNMLRSMSADDLRKRNSSLPPSQAERASLEREMVERAAHNQDLPPGLIASHMNMHPGAIPHHYVPSATYSKLPPSVMSVTPIPGREHSRMKLDELNKHNEMKLYHERERVAIERERAIRDQERLASRGLPHERTIHEQVPSDSWEIYCCQACGLSFTQKHALDKHRCVSEASKPYQCGRCQLSFEELQDLREHMVMHTSERPFKCGVCARSFSGTSALSAHMRSHTMNEPLPQNDIKHSSIECQKCGKRFSQLSDMNKHIASGDCIS